jgi:hypothetical protein
MILRGWWFDIIVLNSDNEKDSFHKELEFVPKQLPTIT